MAAIRRVLLTADTVGGVWTFAVELARGLSARGIEVGIGTLGAPLDRQQWREVNAVEGLRIFESSFRMEWMPEPWEDVCRAGDWLLDVERWFQPDVIHLNQYCFGAVPFTAPVIMTGHSCVLSWWRAVHGCDAPAEWNRYREQVARGLRGARIVTAPSEAMRRCLDEHYGPLPHSTVIPNGRARLSAEPVSKQPWFFAAGRLWDEAKNLETLEAIAARLPWPVYLAGTLDHPDGRRHESSGCCFLGRLTQRQMAWWMNRAAVYVLPARYEPFGLSILEAALCGCALLVGDIPSLREVWGDAAAFVRPDDSSALLEAARELAGAPEKRIEMAQRARQRAEQFSTARMVDRYLAAYETVHASGTSPAQIGYQLAT